MTKTELRKEFDKVIAQTHDADAVARLEVAREYFTNDDFRAKVEEHTFNETYGVFYTHAQRRNALATVDEFGIDLEAA